MYSDKYFPLLKDGLELNKHLRLCEVQIVLLCVQPPKPVKESVRHFVVIFTLEVEALWMNCMIP